MQPITETEAKAAVRSFQDSLIRRIQYEIAIDSVDAAIQKTSRFTLGEALSAAMATLNRHHYQHKGFDNNHFESIGKVLVSTDWHAYRSRKLSGLTDADEIAVRSIFGEFETVLGPVGASRALNLLAPEFFPIWTRPIAKAYGFKISAKSESYWEFMRLSEPRYLELQRFLDSKYPLLIILNECNLRRSDLTA